MNSRIHSRDKSQFEPGDLDGLVTIALQAVGLGYDLVRNTTPTEIRHKGDRDIVTQVDLTVEHEIRAFLAHITPLPPSLERCWSW